MRTSRRSTRTSARPTPCATSRSISSSGQVTADHRSVRLRQVDTAPLPQPDARDGARARASKARCCSMGRTSTRAASTRSRCAAASAWYSSVRRRSPRCRSATTSRRDSRSRQASGRTAPRSTRSSKRPLRRAALWDEVKDRLRDERDGALRRPAAAALHRARAGDRAAACCCSTSRRRRSIRSARRRSRSSSTSCAATITVVIVTHNMQQAARVSDRTAFMLAGELVEVAPTRAALHHAADPRTEAYITGRFG